MIGKLIPAGTGMKRYRGVEIDYGENDWRMHGTSQIAIDHDEQLEVAEEAIEVEEVVVEEPKVYGETAIIE